MEKIKKVWAVGPDRNPATSTQLTSDDLNQIGGNINELIDWVGNYKPPVLTVNGKTGKVELTAADLSLDISGLYEHVSGVNPHGVTYKEVGADPAGAANGVMAVLNSHIVEYKNTIAELRNLINKLK